MSHYVPNKKFSNPIGIINKIAYHPGNTIYEPIEGLTLGKMTENLSKASGQKARLLEILAAKKNDEKSLETHVHSLYTAEKK